MINQKFVNKEIIVIGYSSENIELKHLLEEVGATDVCYYHSDKLKKLLESNNKHHILQFNTIDEEVRYIFNVVINNFSLNTLKKCFICDINSYKPFLEQYAEKYGIKLYFDSCDSFANTKIGKDLLQIVKSKENILSYIEQLKLEVDDETKEFLLKVENLVNENLCLEIGEDGKVVNDIYENFSYLLSTIKIKYPHFENEILVTNRINFDTSYEYYVLGASDSFLPRLVKNNKILDDAILKSNNLNDSIIENIETEVLTDVFIGSNLIKQISYYSQKGKDKVYPTTLIEEEPVIPNNLDYDFSKEISGAYLSKALDIKRKYNKSTFDLNYESNLDKTQPFDSSFNKDGFEKDENRFIKLSYSSLNDLFECPFKYYVKHILRIDNYETNFGGKLGSYIHSLFENINSLDFETAFAKAWNKENLSNTMTTKELMFVKADKKRMRFAYEMLQTKLFKSYSISEYKAEQQFKTSFKPNLILEGRIDGYAISEPSKNLVILDYKSGGYNVGKIDSYNKGLDLQLLVYCYLIANDKKTKNLHIAGAYYCPVLSNVLNESSEEYIDSFKISGLSFGNLLENSGILKNKRFKLDVDVDASFKDIIEAKMYEAEGKIRNFNFSITPFDRKEACKYCQFEAICFKRFAKECLDLDTTVEEDEENGVE